MVSLINSLYLAGPTRLFEALDWTSDPTDDFGIIKTHIYQAMAGCLRMHHVITKLLAFDAMLETPNI